MAGNGESNGKRVITDAQFAALKTEHGDGRVCVIETDAVGDIAFRSPKRMELKRFQEQVGPDAKGAQRAAAIENLVMATVVSPDRAEFEALLQDYPGLPMTCINPLLELAAVEDKPRVRK